MTPLLYACSTGLADVVVELAERRADMNVVDDNRRGCLQLRSQVHSGDEPAAGAVAEKKHASNEYGWVGTRSWGEANRPRFVDLPIDFKPQSR